MWMLPVLVLTSMFSALRSRCRQPCDSSRAQQQQKRCVGMGRVGVKEAREQLVLAAQRLRSAQAHPVNLQTCQHTRILQRRQGLAAAAEQQVARPAMQPRG
jgi:hypothetical protein